MKSQNKTASIRLTAISLLIASSLTLGNVASAEELSAGTVIDKGNIDDVLNDTFMGHPIRDLITERVEYMIREWDFRLPLSEGQEPELDDRYVELTEEHSGKVSFDPETRNVSGWVAGMPFPDVSENDPHAGDKLMWNHYYASTAFGDSISNPNVFYLFGTEGFESTQGLAFERIRTKGRWSTPHNIGDTDELKRTYIVNTYPQDVKGTGTFTTVYDSDDKADNNFAYIRSARRIRRLSGNTWMDPVGAFDFINDDVFVYDARPSRYAKNELVGKRWILAPIDVKPQSDPNKAGTRDQHSHIDASRSLFSAYNKEVAYTPREVWVVEATPPDAHPYSKKVIYMDTDLTSIYVGEAYDKRGEFWRFIQFHFAMVESEQSDRKYHEATGGAFFDVKIPHATYFVSSPATHDSPDATLDNFTPQGLRRFQ